MVFKFNANPVRVCFCYLLCWHFTSVIGEFVYEMVTFYFNYINLTMGDKLISANFLKPPLG